MAIVTDHVEETLVERMNTLPPQGPRVRWAGVMSGFFVAIGVLIMMGALGLVIRARPRARPPQGSALVRVCGLSSPCSWPCFWGGWSRPK
jgi:hypothetical protein